ncbi:MAG TPA: NAD(P)-binding domain-containing protein [Bacteroidota bacterium]|nr:NAD(P)-binding domain-containing protein [Bacteroidota bacterium]
MQKKIGVIGSGTVGQALANGFIRHGYEVMIGTNNRSKHAALESGTGGKAAVGSFAETGRFGDIVVLAVKGTGAESAVRSTGADVLSGKTVLDATNPIAETAPVNGVIAYFTGPNESLLERLQKLAPGAHFVKSFSCVGASLMVNPDFGGLKPSMFICGNDAAAKRQAGEILLKFGWEIEDLGGAEAARAIEPLAMLWCIPGFLKNDWTHAFKLLKK